MFPLACVDEAHRNCHQKMASIGDRGDIPQISGLCCSVATRLRMCTLGYVWTAPWQELSDISAALVGCGHVSGLFVRQIWPLALMLCADRVPIESTHFKVR